MELLPQISRFSTRSRVRLPLRRRAAPRIAIAEFILPPPPLEIVVVPQPGDLFPLIPQGVGRVPSSFISWGDLLAQIAAAGGGPSYLYFGTTTTIALPTLPLLQEWIRVKDDLGLASFSHQLTVTGPIDGGAVFVFNQPFAAADFVWNGTKWLVY